MAKYTLASSRHRTQDAAGATGVMEVPGRAEEPGGRARAPASTRGARICWMPGEAGEPSAGALVRASAGSARVRTHVPGRLAGAPGHRRAVPGSVHVPGRLTGAPRCRRAALGCLASVPGRRRADSLDAEGQVPRRLPGRRQAVPGRVEVVAPGRGRGNARAPTSRFAGRRGPSAGAPAGHARARGGGTGARAHVCQFADEPICWTPRAKCLGTCQGAGRLCQGASARTHLLRCIGQDVAAGALGQGVTGGARSQGAPAEELPLDHVCQGFSTEEFLFRRCLPGLYH